MLESCFDVIHDFLCLHKIPNFMHFSRKHHIPTDGPTNRPPSYRDAGTHLKIPPCGGSIGYRPLRATAQKEEKKEEEEEKDEEGGRSRK